MFVEAGPPSSQKKGPGHAPPAPPPPPPPRFALVFKVGDPDEDEAWKARDVERKKKLQQQQPQSQQQRPGLTVSDFVQQQSQHRQQQPQPLQQIEHKEQKEQQSGQVQSVIQHTNNIKKRNEQQLIAKEKGKAQRKGQGREQKEDAEIKEDIKEEGADIDDDDGNDEDEDDKEEEGEEDTEGVGDVEGSIFGPRDRSPSVRAAAAVARKIRLARQSLRRTLFVTLRDLLQTYDSKSLLSPILLSPSLPPSALSFVHFIAYLLCLLSFVPFMMPAID